MLLFKPWDLLEFILDEAEEEPPAEDDEDIEGVEEDADPPLEWLFILALSMVKAGAFP